MSLFTKLFEAVHSWRRRHAGIKSRKRSALEMEQLDHRQLLTVNFTGNVAADFLATTNPGVVVIPSPPTNQKPLIPSALQGVINVSGLEIDQLRVSYDAAADILSVGVEGPSNGKTGQPVIAGDSDNNLNSGTVDPSVTAIQPAFMDPPDMGGTKTYGVELDFANNGVASVVAGFPITAPVGQTIKPFEVTKALVNPINPTGAPQFDNANIFPQYTGNYYLANDPNHPNFEFQITHFSQLYQQSTGTPLTTATQIGFGAFASNNQDGGISDEFFPPQTVSIQQATVPPVVTPPPPPPVIIPVASPTVYVNFHEKNHINSVRPSAVRVNVLGSSGFDPTTIIPSTVRFGDPASLGTTGASPILNFERNVNRDQFPDETFVFSGRDVVLPPGISTAQISGQTTAGVFFNSQVRVFNRDASFFTPAQLAAQQKAFLKYDAKNGIDTSNGAVAPPPVIPKAAQQRAASLAIDDLYAPFAHVKAPKQVNPGLGAAEAASIDGPPVVVSIPTRHGKGSHAKNVKVSNVRVSTSAMTNSTPTIFAGGA